MADNINSVDTSGTSTPMHTTTPNSDTGDVLSAIQAAQKSEDKSDASIIDKMEQIRSSAEGLNNVFGSKFTQNLEDRLSLHKITNDYLRQQRDRLLDIYNLLVYWGKKGGIQDPTKAGFVEKGVEDKVTAAHQSQINSLMHNISTTSHQTAALISDLEKNQKSLSQLIERISQRTADTWQRVREDSMVNYHQAAVTQDKWEKVLDKAQKVFNPIENIQASDNADQILKKLNEAITTRSIFDSGNPIPEFDKQKIEDAEAAAYLNKDVTEKKNAYFEALRSLGETALGNRDATIADIQKAYDEKKLKGDSPELAETVKEGLDDLVRLEAEWNSAQKSALLDELKKQGIDLGEITKQSELQGLRLSESLTSFKNFLSDPSWKSRGNAAGTVAGGVAGEAASEALAPAIEAGVVALAPELAPMAPLIGEAGGEVAGKLVQDTVVKYFEAWGEYFDYLVTHTAKVRDNLLQVGLDKIRQDVKTMSTYQVDIYEQATQKIYAVWDKNLAQVTATQGYTKEALNALQDSVAKELQEMGYANAINAADFTDTLVSALNANLSGELANTFAAQSMILQKAIPEFNPMQMAEQFAAIWTRANREEEGTGEDMMVEAMNQVAGAIKAIEKNTDGNNQFIKQVPAYLQKAEELVARAGGSVDKVAGLTTQMMAAEGPLAALTPQLSGFTGELVNILTDQNNSTAVALRSIMHDMDETIGITATDFLKSFMDDSKNTLEVAYRAIDDFITKNANPAAQQEFYSAMTTLFGISADKLAQIDFGYIADQISQTNASLNQQALIDAENLVKEGETATFEEQLVNNTTNMLLATNAVADTIDNKVMRELEKHELQLERLVYETVATQSVDFAETTLTFFKNIADVFLTILDPLHLVRDLFNGVNTVTSALYSLGENQENYRTARHLSSVGSSAEAWKHSLINTTGGVAVEMLTAASTNGNAFDVQKQMEYASVSGSTEKMYERQKNAGLASTIVSNEAVKKAMSAQAEIPSVIDMTSSTTPSEEEAARRESDKKDWDKKQSAAQAAVEAKELEKQAVASASDEAIQNISQNVSQFTGYFEQGLGKLDSLEEDIQTTHSHLETIVSHLVEYTPIIKKWWEQDEPFLSNVQVYFQKLYEHIQSVEYKVKTDFFKSTSSGIEGVVSAVNNVNESVGSLKSTFDSSLGSTGSSLGTIVSNQGAIKSTITASSDVMKSELSDTKNKVVSVQSAVTSYVGIYTDKQNIANNSLSNINLNTSQTVNTITAFKTQFEKDIILTRTAIGETTKAVNDFNAADKTRVEDSRREYFKPIKDDVSSILTYLKDDTKNIVFKYLEAKILPAINLIRSGSSGNDDLKTVVDRLQSILSVLGKDGNIGQAVGAVSGTLNDYKDSWKSIDHRGSNPSTTLDQIVDAINKKELVVNVTQQVVENK